MTHPIKSVTRDELRAMLYGITTTTIVSLVSAVEPRCNAKDKDGNPNPYKAGRTMKDGLTITKVNKSNGLIGGKTDEIGNLYHRMVSNALRKTIIEERIEANEAPLSEEQLAAEIDERFKRGESWFRHLLHADGSPSALVVHKDDTDDGEAYLRFIFRSKGTAEYLHLKNGSKLSSQQVEPFLQAQRAPKNQGLPEGEEIRFVVYSLASILEIALNGERYRITDNFDAMQPPCREIAVQIADEYLTEQRRLMAV